ncbi:MAG: hypothetical protein HZA08_11805 [Nitrospirae bacterium]|nr:hypothetical protein [Nitrospirota bacterium]
MKTLLFTITIILTISCASYAQDITFHGFIQSNISSRITGKETPDPSEGGDFLSGGDKIRAEVTGGSGDSDFALKADLVHDSISGNDEVNIREGYIDYRSTNYDLRIGRQIITWGIGDLLFINDIYPKNYSALFSGQPMEYLKTGSDAIKIASYSDTISTELVIIPFFEPYTLPDPKRFFMYSPMTIINSEKPRNELENTETALRLYRQIQGFDTTIYVYRGFYKTPGMRPASLTEAVLFYPHLSVYGFSVQGNFANGVLGIEGGYYDSRDDRNGDDFTTPNSATKYILGYSRQFWTDFTAGVQYYGEYMHQYNNYESSLPAGMPKTDNLHQLITLRLTQMLKYNTLRLSLFSFYSPDDKDCFIIPEIRYNITDSLWTEAGFNFFGGKDTMTFFGQFDKNDNLFATLRYEF